jgi:hypothetical protein
MMVLIVLNKLVIINNSLLLLTISLSVAIVAYLLIWMMIPDGKENLIEIIYDLSRSLYLDKYFLLVISQIKKAKVL